MDQNGNPTNGRVPFIARNSRFTGPGFFDTDMRISREFKPTERTRVEFLWEAFNIFNRYNPVPSSGIFAVDNLAYSVTAASASPTAACSSATVGAGLTNFAGCLNPRSSFLNVTSTGNTLYTARQMQFGLKFSF